MLFDTDGPEPELVASFQQTAEVLQKQNAVFMLRAQSKHTRFKSCQYIAGEPSTDDSCKCGAPTDEGGIYCDQHHGLCIPKPAPEKQEALAEAA
ncbi:hypothetical protein HBA54_04905 [Pelagibius litoralis]|uniref:Uncharacterized protein n=1 Tax=Pelagibius litoralis TaxID=374515 RepID=A0A967EX64_9PROT|nr:hypothetical protein [Pelagibius litoralis]NIA67925.1 hypothetical protein [Pelagibius litoralis]